MRMHVGARLLFLGLPVLGLALGTPATAASNPGSGGIHPPAETWVPAPATAINAAALPAAGGESPDCAGDAAMILAADDPDRAAASAVARISGAAAADDAQRCHCLSALAGAVVAARPQTTAALAMVITRMEPRCLLVGERAMQSALADLTPNGISQTQRGTLEWLNDGGDAIGRSCGRLTCGMIEPTSVRLGPVATDACPAAAGVSGSDRSGADADTGGAHPCGTTDNAIGARATVSLMDVASGEGGEYLLDLISRVLSVFRQLLARN